MPDGRKGDLSSFVDGLQASGRYTFERAQILRGHKGSAVGLEAALRRLKAKGRLARPRRGFFVIVPLEYRTAGSPPASWFIDDLMKFLGRKYYVGLLSAAGLHGAAHQQPMVFQVVTEKPLRPVFSGRNRIEFHMSRLVESTAVVEMQTETGFMRVSTPEATAMDLVRFPEAAGHLGNVATVLSELAETLDAGGLVREAGRARTPEVQRLGFLLESLGHDRLAGPLAAWLSRRPHRAVRLRPGKAVRSARLDRTWRILVNETVEADL